MCLLGKTAVLLGIYKLRILAVGNLSTDSGICLQKSRCFG